MKKIEILAPAGSMESLKAGIAASCDGVYIGGSKFGARAYANNPSQDMLLEAIDYAHIHDKKIYLTLNTLLKNHELEEDLYDFLYKYYLQGLDAVIVQDMGVVNFIHKYFPKLPIHGSTQMTLNMAEGANLLKDFGLTRFVPSRELSLEEIKRIRKETDLEIEVFVHGALCYCYSGQCLMSSLFGGRSGNRGRCAQPCRMPYSLLGEKEDSNGYNEIPLSNKDEKYLISPKDICTLDLIPDLIDAGVDSFKIEGRMKRPEYTAITTYTYGKYVDKYLELGRQGYERYLYDNKKNYDLDKKNLLDIYNRGGFTKGYLDQRNGRSMITLKQPNHSGIKVGKVEKASKGHVWILLEDKLNKGDLLKIVGKNDSYEYTTGVESEKGKIVSTNYDRRIKLRPGDLVYRVRNNRLLESISDRYINEKIQVPIQGKVIAEVGKKLKIILEKKDLVVEEFGDIIEEAKNQPMTKDRIYKQIEKTKDTNFYFHELDISMKGNVFIPVKKINELRRNGIAKLEEELLKEHQRFTKDNIKNSKNLTKKLRKQEKVLYNESWTKKDDCKLAIHVLVHTKEQLHEVLKRSEVAAIYIDSNILPLQNISQVFEQVKSSNKKVYLYMPHIFRGTSYDYFLKNKSALVADTIDGYIIRNLEEYHLLYHELQVGKLKKEMISDHNLYIMNREGKEFWNKLQLSKFTAPIELNKHELLELKGMYEDIIVYGRLPLMVTAQCLVKTVSGGDNSHLDRPLNGFCCGKGIEKVQLIDRLDKKFPVTRNCTYCYNTIYNSTPLSLLKNHEDVLALKTKNIRLDFTIESGKETAMVLDRFIESFFYQNKVEEIKDFTRGHFNRGID